MGDFSARILSSRFNGFKFSLTKPLLIDERFSQSDIRSVRTRVAVCALNASELHCFAPRSGELNLGWLSGVFIYLIDLRECAKRTKAQSLGREPQKEPI
jgi:hypothetical protein